MRLKVTSPPLSGNTMTHAAVPQLLMQGTYQKARRVGGFAISRGRTPTYHHAVHLPISNRQWGLIFFRLPPGRYRCVLFDSQPTAGRLKILKRFNLTITRARAARRARAGRPAVDEVTIHEPPNNSRTTGPFVAIQGSVTAPKDPMLAECRMWCRPGGGNNHPFPAGSTQLPSLSFDDTFYATVHVDEVPLHQIENDPSEQFRLRVTHPNAVADENTGIFIEVS